MPISFGDGIGHDALTVENTAVGFDEEVIGTADFVFYTAEGAQMRFCYDGTTPTNAIGHLLEVGDAGRLEGNANILAFRAIRVSGSGTAGSIRYTPET